MIVFSGPPRGGKTRLMEMFVKAFKGYATSKTVDSFIDLRETAVVCEENNIIFFDEFSNIAGQKMRLFKDLIDNRFNTYRPMGTNINEKVDNNACFIGCTNEDMSDLLKDPTGYRKFFEIKINSSEYTKSHWEQVNMLNIINLFKCIDENRRRLFE
jgi:predicted P-loop ATPase